MVPRHIEQQSMVHPLEPPDTHTHTHTGKQTCKHYKQTRKHTHTSTQRHVHTHTHTHTMHTMHTKAHSHVHVVMYQRTYGGELTSVNGVSLSSSVNSSPSDLPWSMKTCLRAPSGALGTGTTCDTGAERQNQLNQCVSV